MAKIIRAIIGIIWLAATSLMVYILFDVLNNEPDPQAVWAWIVTAILVFLSVSTLAYNAIFQSRNSKSHFNQQ